MDNTKKRFLSGKIRRFRAKFAQENGIKIGDVLPDELIGRCIAEEIGEYRERIYSPMETLTLFVDQVLSADHSCQDTVARGLSSRVAQGLKPCSLSTCGYCKARKRLPLEFCKRLCREAGNTLCKQQPSKWLWREREIKLVDGTTVSMPDTPENQVSFPQSKVQKKGIGFPVARLVAIISLSCATVLDWAIGPCEGKETGETALLRKMLGQFKAGDIVIADRYFSNYFLIAMLLLMGVDVIFRQHQCRKTDFKSGTILGARDHIVEWQRPPRPKWMDAALYETMPKTLRMREVKVGGWVLATSLLDAKTVSKEELRRLYEFRWLVELDLRSIKCVMQMEILRCKTPDMVCKEIAVHFLAYNLVRAVMAQSATISNLLIHQLSFKGAMQMVNAFGDIMRHCPQGRTEVNHAVLIGGIAKMKLPCRPDRIEPRAVKRRPKVQDLLTKPRQQMRETIIQQRKQEYGCLS